MAAATDIAGLMCPPDTHPNIWIAIMTTMPKLRTVCRWLYSLPHVRHPKQPRNTRMAVPSTSLKNTDSRSINCAVSPILLSINNFLFPQTQQPKNEAMENTVLN